MSESKERIDESGLSALLCASLEGNSDMYIVREIVKRLDKELEESGKDTFTMGDLRRIRDEIFGA